MSVVSLSFLVISHELLSSNMKSNGVVIIKLQGSVQKTKIYYVIGECLIYIENPYVIAA